MMNIFSGRKFLDVISFGLVVLALAPRLSFAQASEMESLRALVKDMQQQLQKALSRIDQLEKEKAADSAKIGPSGKIGAGGAKLAVDLEPGDRACAGCHVSRSWERQAVISIFALRN